MKAQKIEPPANTVAIVVDVPHNKGAIRIYNSTENDAYIGTVGTEDAGFMVIIPWEGSWWFRVLGKLRVGFIAVQNS